MELFNPHNDIIPPLKYRAGETISLKKSLCQHHLRSFSDIFRQFETHTEQFSTGRTNFIMIDDSRDIRSYLWMAPKA